MNSNKLNIYIALTLLLFITWQLLEAVAINFLADSNELYYRVKIVSDLLLVIILTIICARIFGEFNFQITLTTTTVKLSLLTLVIMLFALYSKSFSLSGVSSTFLAAASEELVFRGIIFPCLLLLFVKSDQRILNSIVICSILFGSIHLLHMFRHPEQWIGIVLQSLGAFSLSMVLCYSMIKSSNIILVTFFHFAVNLFLKNAERSNNPIGYESNIENFSFDLAGLAFTIGIIVLVNAYLVAKMNTLDKTDYDIKLNHSIT